MGHKETVIHLFEELMACPEADNLKCFDALVQVYPLMDNRDKLVVSKEFYDRAMQTAAQGSTKIAITKLAYGLAHVFNDKYEDAIQLCEGACALFEEQGSKDGVAATHFGIGIVHRSIGNMDMALNALWDCYDQLSKSGALPHITMGCGYQIAGVYSERENYDEALDLFEKTYVLANKLASTAFIISTLQGLGKTYLALKRFDEAKETLETVLAKAEEAGAPMFVANMKSELCSYYCAIGDNDTAEQYAKDALALREQQGIIAASVTSLIQLGDIYTARHMPNEAIAALDKGLALAEQVKVKPKMAKIHQMLSGLYEQLGDPEKSLQHYKQYHKIHNEVEIDNAARKIKNMRLAFEAEQTKKENIIIKRQKAEIEQKNIELQETIDELTRVKVSRKAKAFTFFLAIVLFVLVDLVLEVVLPLLPKNNFLLTLAVKMIIIFSLRPVEVAIEHYLLKKIMRKKRELRPALEGVA